MEFKILKSDEWYEGYKRYWHGGPDCPYERGTWRNADWWSGWEEAAAEDGASAAGAGAGAEEREGL